MCPTGISGLLAVKGLACTSVTSPSVLVLWYVIDYYMKLDERFHNLRKI